MSKLPPTLCPDFTPKRCDSDQNFFCMFCCPYKNRGPHVFSFLICAFVFELWSQTKGTSKIKNQENLFRLHFCNVFTIVL